MIAGDFNSLGRSRGFDAIERSGGGYAIAAAQHRWFRATYSANFPLYDIEHVVARLGERRSVLHVRNHGTNHRGQCVLIRLGQRR